MENVRLKFQHPHLSFDAPGPYCLVCGERPAYPRRVRFPRVDFFAPLCGRHLRRAQLLWGSTFLLAAIALGLACVIPWFPINLLAILPATLALVLYQSARRGGLPCTVESSDGGMLVLQYRRPLVVRPQTEPGDYRSYRPPPPPAPFEYILDSEYSRDQVTAGGTLLAGGRFAAFADRILAFFDFSELRVESPEQLVWAPKEGKSPWLPEELRDGSERARRGIALFLSQDQGAWTYAGRAELTNWPVDPGAERRAQFSLDVPFRVPTREFSPAVEEALRSLDSSSEQRKMLRWVAAGDTGSWSELSEKISHQGEVKGDFVRLVPFLLALLKDPEFPPKEQLLWIFALAAKSPAYIVKAAAQGVESYFALLDAETLELRRPAAFALQTCEGISERLHDRAMREKDETVRASMIATLGTYRNPALLPFFLEELRSGSSPFLKAVAALAAVETAPEAPPIEAVCFLEEVVASKFPLEDEWTDMDPAGAALLDPETILARL